MQGPGVHTGDGNAQEVHPIPGRDLGVMVHKGTGLSRVSLTESGLQVDLVNKVGCLLDSVVW